ncbi:type III restriction-modification system endonuclease [Peptostreptococcus canis]|uniref:Type III restriction-modification system endonuclease n=1 Tax=Peptostreptococcus canis TaxID=1159213 RepID=A0ABR6TIK0_9FIRM|nr:type III restriction-modification system endonuclease [Peptostreptococcus canis]MBC2575252.1 type III restriction-modification system endonuclease [Peptostreptococcus canis]MBP1997566.1 type III restriction enzyme [Peptostreptococcus canis]
MAIKLSILPHQTQCLERISKVFEGVYLHMTDNIFSNPVFDANNTKLKDNIAQIQEGFEGNIIARDLRTSVSNEFGIDVRMETGTGKTYCYTRLMYELNKKYGFHKFIILVPTTPIKEGTKSFIESDYANSHFSDLYPDKRIALSVLNAQKKTKGRKMFPQAISDFARGTALEKGRINVLLMSSGMLLSKATMDNEYDQTLFGTFSNPYDTLKATRPIVIIDEPHKFKRENTAYKRLIERINPLCVIRFGATFPNLPKFEKKDYNNLVFNLGSLEAFNNNLVKGVATQMIAQESLNETKVKLMEIVNTPKSCVFRNEKTGRSYTLSLGDVLSIVEPEFGGISIESIGKTDDEEIKRGVTLSNGQILEKGDLIYAGIYGTTYQELMMKQAVKNHVEQERENFFRERKIKTLSLFFIDSIYSYRGENGSDGALRASFHNILKENLEGEIEKYKNSASLIHQEYVSFIESSLKDIGATNGGYFAEDNSNSDEDIQKEVDQILRDKQSLLTFKDEKGNWNTRRFIFSKWTLREGWDNPNVFQICKLRSSGSEISKLQEVGRGLRLPVDEYGNRISDEQFYLTYLFDYSEKDFADRLIGEINQDSKLTQNNIKLRLGKVAADRGMDENILYAQLLINKYIDVDGNINYENRDKFIAEYPEFNVGLEQNKVISKDKKDQGVVYIRKDKFAKIKELWTTINKKYYLSLDKIPNEELYKASLEILNKGIRGDVLATTIEKRTSVENGGILLKEATSGYYVLDESIPYGEFLKQVQVATGLPVMIMHKALCDYNRTNTLDKTFFNRNTLTKFILEFQLWFEEAFLKRFSYKALDVESLETALTDINGEVKEKIVQGTVGIIRDDSLFVPENFLYDKVVFDSPKEKETVQRSNIDEVVVFGKIPRRSVQVPLYFGGTTSPDFMYVIQRDDKFEINFIVETKDIDKESSLRGSEKLKIVSAKKFFEELQKERISVSFEPQLKSDDIITMINRLTSK